MNIVNKRFIITNKICKIRETSFEKIDQVIFIWPRNKDFAAR